MPCRSVTAFTSDGASPAASRTSRPLTAAACPQHCPPASETNPVPIEESAENTASDTRAGRHARRLSDAVHALTHTRRSHSSIARELGLNRRTVAKYAQARTWQEVMRRPPRKPSTLDPYLDYLQQRWDEGEHSAKILHEELQNKGYLGHYQRVKMAVAPLRRRLPIDEPRERPPSPSEAARWITTHAHRRNPHINDRLPRLLDHCPELKHTHDLVRRFATMLDNRDSVPLPGWLTDFANSGLSPLTGLAGALHEDRHTVAQGITTPYNSGVNEGRITDAKLQKRLLARRAGVPLLRRHFADPADRVTEMISGYENLARAARATFTCTPTPSTPAENANASTPGSTSTTTAPWPDQRAHPRSAAPIEDGGGSWHMQIFSWV